ncbi:hypothetical protein DFH09DRAFT_1071711 [Mycena vulgaris]|nr:hypothetical protein DFH09DRAFT_1071711 [Mycena vulgaris]
MAFFDRRSNCDDIDDRFLISINPDVSTNQEVAEYVKLEDDTNRSWDIFNGSCERRGHRETSYVHLLMPRTFNRSKIIPGVEALVRIRMGLFQENVSEILPSVPPWREYVWRAIACGDQSLATVARRITLDLNLKLSSVNKVPARCAGYIREEITLATTLVDSAVVSHDIPSPLEVCSVCHEVVDFEEVFHYICGDLGRHDSTGFLALTWSVSRFWLATTAKCQGCRLWGHIECVGNSNGILAIPTMTARRPVQPTTPAFKMYAQLPTYLFIPPDAHQEYDDSSWENSDETFIKELRDDWKTASP